MITALLTMKNEFINDVFSETCLHDIAQTVDLRIAENITAGSNIEKWLKLYKPEILITGWGSPPLNEMIPDKCEQLRYVCHCGGTIKRIIPRDLVDKGLIVTNWGDFPSSMVAEAALTGILSCLRKLPFVHEVMHHEHGWMRLAESRTETLFHKKVGIFGFGHSGQYLARLLKPFCCRVSAFSPFENQAVFEKYGVERIDSLKELFLDNQIISIHAAASKENVHIIDKKMLSLLKDGSIVVNTARGNIVDETALIDELVTGRLQASLDVYETEPLPEDSPLRGLKNVQLIPHQASPTADQRHRIGELVLDNIRRYVHGDDVKNRITADMYDWMT